jgi:hypothetical protein
MPDLRQCRAVIRSLLYLLLCRVLGLIRANEREAAEAELEIAVLRHQIAILSHQVKRPPYRTPDRAFLAAASRLLPREAWRAVRGTARDPGPVAPAARGQEMDAGASPSGTPFPRSRGSPAGPAPGEGEPQVGLHADPR